MKKVNNILLISPEYPAETGIGGIGTYVNYMARQLRECDPKIKVTVLSISYDQYKDYEEDGIRVIRLKVNRRNIFDRFWKCTSWLIKNYSKYDVIEDEIFGGWGFFARLILGKKYKYIAHIHGTTYEVAVLERLTGFLRKLKCVVVGFMERYLAKNAKMVVFDSSLIEVYVSFLWKLDFGETYIFPNPFICDDTRSLVVPEKFKKLNYFLFFGRVQKKKGSDILRELVPRLLKKFPEASFVFVGTDVVNMKRDFEGNKRVIFIDFVSDKSELFGIIKNSKVVVLPSLFESFLYTAVESIIMGVPTVLNSNCGVSQFLKQYDGYNNVVSRFNDTDMYINTIENIMKNYNSSLKYAKLQAESLKKDLSSASVAIKYLELIEKYYE